MRNFLINILSNISKHFGDLDRIEHDTPEVENPEIPNEIIEELDKQEKVKMLSENTVYVVRDTYTDNETIGEIIIGSDFRLECIERPWKDNQARVSCIPEGTYPLGLRNSPIVYRTTRRRARTYEYGYEVQNVPNRTVIMLHIANTASELMGCIAPGLSRGHIRTEAAVLSSGDAFDKLMAKLATRDDWQIVVTNKDDFKNIL